MVDKMNKMGGFVGTRSSLRNCGWFFGNFAPQREFHGGLILSYLNCLINHLFFI